jgi:hypothetical protein
MKDNIQDLILLIFILILLLEPVPTLQLTAAGDEVA